MNLSGQDCDLLNEIFSTAIFVSKPGEYYDAGTEAKLLDVLYVVGDGEPCGLFRGLRDGKEDEEVSVFSEFVVTWPSHREADNA